MGNKIIAVAYTTLVIFACLSCPAPAECEAKLNVLTTHTVLKSIAEEVGGEHVSVSSLATGREDPHAMQAKPSYMAAARRADLFIKIGMELEIGYEQLLIDGSRNYGIRLGQPGHLDTSLNIHRREVPTTRVDRSMGDVHPLGNPHYWMDPYNARIVALSIARKLAQLDPANASSYEANCQSFQKRLDTAMFGEGLIDLVGGSKLWSLAMDGRLDSHLREKGLEARIGGWYGQSGPLRGAELITYHRSWGYFANRFGLNVIEELEPKPGIPPSPGHMRHVIEIARQRRIKLILMEPYYSHKPAEFVCEKSGARLVEAANAIGGQPGVDDYFSLIENVIRRLIEAIEPA